MNGEDAGFTGADAATGVDWSIICVGGSREIGAEESRQRNWSRDRGRGINTEKLICSAAIRNRKREEFFHEMGT